MTDGTQDISLAIMKSRCIYELAIARTITDADLNHVIKGAMKFHNAPRVVISRIEWSVDDAIEDLPVGKYGSRVSADVEMLLVGGISEEGPTVDEVR